MRNIWICILTNICISVIIRNYVSCKVLLGFAHALTTYSFALFLRIVNRILRNVKKRYHMFHHKSNPLLIKTLTFF